ncbi:DUF1997 domain-containing protein [Thermosynechococcus sp. QKsg1]|uniref:DUF1997 domain-containing protein n=1 Tax=unclassified Thermosynechococcus TaxID=2622553 RepID=UPI00122E6EF3|nr:MULTISPECIES: DUF1997 domain-containing protein [unclassified Thermosynechococcus]QEQ01152.1 DUF1997 domain-containing protein [Thermosynechococcus sp. CL-1]WJI25505.1 DUF1997 domain-containing protein [Thermosynechococcus sp. B1]WJI28037.1 DUF1997 domain-containing protein [Thermosynechococcus sp. B3]WKT82593.1 DUF1997 domain-containing protein [Thermosynechococcus sp. HY596]WNC61718.1 DUF1997 domain-containing protein [Thermosynechococcus sp. HY591]
MYLEFKASQSVRLSIETPTAPLQHYLRQPQRLVYALTDPTRVEFLGSDRFRLKMRPLNFLMVSLQPTVDLAVHANSDGSLQLRSLGCEIRGVDYINRRFHLALEGYLSPQATANGTDLIGLADLQVGVDIPPPLDLTPRPILEATGNGLLKSVLLTMKQRLSQHLVADYQRWLTEVETNGSGDWLTPVPVSSS